MGQKWLPIGVPEQIEPRRTRQFQRTARPVLTFRLQDHAGDPVNISGAAFRASLHLDEEAAATWTVTPTITSTTNGEIQVTTSSAAVEGRMLVFRVRRWSAGDSVPTDPPRGVYEERWDLL